MKTFAAYNIDFYLSDINQSFDISGNQIYKKYTFLNINKKQIYSYHYFNNETYILSLKNINFVLKDKIVKRDLKFDFVELKKNATFYTYFNKMQKSFMIRNYQNGVFVMDITSRGKLLLITDDLDVLYKKYLLEIFK